MNPSQADDPPKDATSTKEKAKPRWSGRALRWAALIAATPIAAFLVLMLVMSGLGITIDFSGFRDRIERVASTALDRPVSIGGAIKLVPSLSPSLQVENIRVGNPTSWPDADFATLGLARAQFGILALLQGEVEIVEITVEGLSVALARNAEGQPNWPLRQQTDTADAPSEPADNTAVPAALRFIELRELSLTDIVVTYQDAAVGQGYELRLNEIKGDAVDQEPMNLFIQGAVQRIPYAVTVNADSLASLFSGEEPWQLDVSAAAVGTNLSISGEIAEPLRGKGLALDFAIKGPELAELETLLDMKLPQVRSFDLRGRIAEAEGAYGLENLKGNLGGTAFAGSLNVDTASERPRLSGRIEVPKIDVAPLGAAVQAVQQSQAKQAPKVEAEPAKAAEETDQPEKPDQPIDIDAAIVTLEPLQEFDADFTLTIKEVINAAVAIRDATLKVAVLDGALTGPLQVNVAEVPFSGEIQLTPQEGGPAARVSLSAAQSEIGDLLSLMTGIEGVEGAFKNAELQATARGNTIRTLVKTSEVHFALGGAALSYGNETGGEPVEFTLDSFEMAVPAAGESKLEAEGTLLREAFSLQLSGGTFIENYIEGEWPLTVNARGGGATLQLRGTTYRGETSRRSEVDFSLAGDSIGGLARWTGVSPKADFPYALRGALNLERDGLVAHIDEGSLGESGFIGQLGLDRQGDKNIAFLEMAFDLIDVEQLTTLAPPKPENEADTAKNFTIDVPILPSGIALFDSDIGVTIDRIKLAPRDVTEISLSAAIRDGHVEKAPLRAVVAGTTIEGNGAADLRGDLAKFDLALQAEAVDIGDMLSQFGVAEGLDAKAGRLDLQLALRGTSLRTILQQSSFSAGLEEGLWRLTDPNSGGSLDIGIPKGRIEAAVGEPIALRLDGRIGEIPVDIAIHTDSLGSFAEAKESLDARLDVKLLKADLKLIGSAPLPLGSKDLRFQLDLKGERASDFDALLGASLPPWGPYKLAGAFGRRAAGYFVEDLELGIGSSLLTGALDLDTTQEPPRLAVDLVAPSIQLDDFKAEGWSPTRGDTAAEEAAADEETAEAGDTEQIKDQAAPSLLSPEVMRSLDGSLSVKVEQVLSGADTLGKGDLEATLQDGRLTVDPLTVDVPGGSVAVAMAFEPRGTEILMGARAKVEQLDYGLLARRIDPQSETGGLISVDVDIETSGPNLKEVMSGSNGHIDFAVWPRDLEAGLFDLWAVNLFTSILPSLDSEASVVNCLVGRFALDDGLMTPTAILMDTSRIQASADGTIDFRKNTVDLTAAPRSKRPQMFSAQTPIKVEGEFADFEVGIAAGGLPGTAIRMITSPVVVPFQWVFTESEPADGKVACEKAWGRTPQG